MAAPFPPPPWDPIPRGDTALQTVQDLPLAQSAAALAMLLDENKDEEILKEACVGLCQLFGDGIQNDRIQAILEADVVPRLVALLKPNRSRSVPSTVQSAALQALLSSNERSIRKEVCWISSNITESSHQVQAVLDAGILPPLLKLLESQDSACREDATWVLYNISSNQDMRQITYLAEQNGIRALCNLLNCSKDLDVHWKGCATVAAVALKGLRNILVAGQQDASNNANGYNAMAALVAEAHGVERIEALTNHVTGDVRHRARLLLERFFGAEQAPTSPESSSLPDDCTNAANAAEAAAASVAAASAVPSAASLSHITASHFGDADGTVATAAAIVDPAAFAVAAAAAAAASTSSTCSCPHPHPHSHGPVYSEHSGHMVAQLPPSPSPTGSLPPAEVRPAVAMSAQFHATAGLRGGGLHPHAYTTGVVEPLLPMPGNGITATSVSAPRALPSVGVDADTENGPHSGGTSTGSSDTDPDDDDSDSDLLPPPPAPCNCVLCTDTTPLVDRRPRKSSTGEHGVSAPALLTASAITSSSSASTSESRGGKGRGGSGGSSRGHGAPSSTGGGAHSGDSTANGRLGSDSGGRESQQVNTGESSDELTRKLSRTLCDFCSGGGRLGDGKAGLAAKLGRAVRLGHSHCVAILLSRMTWSQRVAATEAPALLHPGGGPPDGGVSSSLPAVVLAAHLGKPECLALLLRRCRPDLDLTHGKKRLTPLAWAAHKGYKKCCLLLLDHGASATAKCGECLTALHLAASGGGYLSICRLLLEKGAPVNARSTKEQTALCLATQKGYSRLVDLLLQHGADCNNEDEGKCTPLHIAASQGYKECTEALIRAGATIDCKTRNGVTPLHYAVKGGHDQVVKALVSNGAKVNCTKKPLLIIAADDGNTEVVKILLDALAVIDCTASITATLDKDTKVHDKLTPLHLSASRGHLEVVELLLRRGAAVDARTEKGAWAALDFAVLNGHSGCALALLNSGATVRDTAKNAGQTGHTLIQHAAKTGNKDVVRKLVERLKQQKNAAAHGADSDSAARLGAGAFGGASGASALSAPAPPSPLSLATKGRGSSQHVRGGGNDGGITSGAVEYGSVHGGHQTLAPLKTCPHGSACSQAEHRIDNLSRREAANLMNHGGYQPTRYDPRAPDGDESGFGTSAGYGNGPTQEVNGYAAYPGDADPGDHGPSGTTATPRAAASNNLRRRTVKDETSVANRQRDRELKRREDEANDARERLKEAITQQSVPKLSEAISHVSKLVLHLGTTPVDGVSGTGGAGGSSIGVDGLDDYSSVNGHAHDVGTGVVSGGTNTLATSQAAQASQAAALRIEAGLGNDVQRARRILATLQADERRQKELRAREAAETKRENNQALVQKAITVVLEGGDVRTLNRAVNRAKRAILEDDDTVVQRAGRVTSLITDAAKASSELSTSVKNRDISRLKAAIVMVKQTSGALKELDGQAAAARALGKADPDAVISEAEKKLGVLEVERDVAQAEEEAAQLRQEAALHALQQALDSGSLRDIESSLEEAANGVSSKDSDASAAIDSGKKTFAKLLKSERRKLRQANSSKDVHVIDAAVAAAQTLGVRALRSDVDAAVELSKTLQDQEKCRAELKNAVAEGDVQAINVIRGRLQALGMFAEAESARAELDSLQKASRARSLLSTASKDARDAVATFRSKRENEKSLEWSWPDGQRLCDLVARTKGRYGTSLDGLCKEAEAVAHDLASAGRDALLEAVESGDTRSLAGAITGYEKSFVNVDSSDMFDADSSRLAVSNARARLAALQAKEQEKVKAESAQVKTEYALATSRRSAAKARGSRRIRAAANHNVHSGTGGVQSNAVATPTASRSESVPSTNSSDCGDDDTLDADITLGTAAIDGSRQIGSGGRKHDLSQGGAMGGLVGEGDCSHYYLWKEGTTVECARCRNVRESVNGEWLLRVKRRGSKVPPDVGSTPGVSVVLPVPNGLAPSTLSHRPSVPLIPLVPVPSTPTGRPGPVKQNLGGLPMSFDSHVTPEKLSYSNRIPSHGQLSHLAGPGGGSSTASPDMSSGSLRAPASFIGDPGHASLHMRSAPHLHSRPAPQQHGSRLVGMQDPALHGVVGSASPYTMGGGLRDSHLGMHQGPGVPVSRGGGLSSIAGVPVGHRFGSQNAGSHLPHSMLVSGGSSLGVAPPSSSMLPIASGAPTGLYGDGHMTGILHSHDLSPHGLAAASAHVAGVSAELGMNGFNAMEDASADLSMDSFANENFGFDIDSLLVENNK